MPRPDASVQGEGGAPTCAVRRDARWRAVRYVSNRSHGHVHEEPSPNPVVEVDSAERWRALASPLRQRLLQLLEDGHAWEVKQLAVATYRTPQALYRHLDILLDAGLVVRVGHGTGPDGASRAPTSYRIAGTLRLRQCGPGEPFAADFARAVDRTLRAASRTFAVRPRVPLEAPGYLLQSHLAYLDDEEARALAVQARALHAALDDARARSARSGAPTRPFALLVGFTGYDPARVAPDEDR
jgi:predicted transcriptional regulator